LRKRLNLHCLNSRVDTQGGRPAHFLDLKAVYHDDDPLTAFNLLLVFIGRILDPALDEAVFNGRRHTSGLIDLFNQFDSLPLNLVG
jgi:hypothetical protein